MMNHRYYLAVLTFVAAFILIGCSDNDKEMRAAPTIDVRIMETTDLHAYMLGFDYFRQVPTTRYGLVHTAALIHQARAENPNHILIDNGDLIQGSALGDWVAAQGVSYLEQHVHPIIKALNYLEFDAAALGNHEFNYGLDFLFATIAGADFPFIAANVFHADSPETAGKYAGSWSDPIVEPYVILERDFKDQFGVKHRIRVGVIGFVPPQIMRWDANHLAGRIRVRDIVSAAEHFVPKMRAEGADLVIAVSHSGLRIYSEYPKFAEQATYQLAGVAGIDAILFGHQHQLFPGSSAYDNLPDVDNERGFVRGIPAVAAGSWGDHLGLIDLRLTQTEMGWHIIDSHVSVRAIDRTKDDYLEQLLQAEQESTVVMLNEPLGELEQRVSSLFGRVIPESGLQLINNAQTWYVQKLQAEGSLPDDLPVLSAAAPFRNGSQGPHDYTLIEAGPFTLGNLVDLYVYPNTLQVVLMNAEQVREWLEMSANAFQHIHMEGTEPQELFTRFPSYNFDVISGITYRIDPTQPQRYSNRGELIDPDSHRIVDMQWQGEPVNADQLFLVATNNYRAGGGGNFPNLDGSTLVYASDSEVRRVIADYARYKTQETAGTLRLEVINNWQLMIPPTATVRFRGSPSTAAQQMIQGVAEIKTIAMDEQGFVIFELKGPPAP